MSTVTVQVLEPVTATLRLYQLLPLEPADSVAVHELFRLGRVFLCERAKVFSTGKAFEVSGTQLRSPGSPPGYSHTEGLH
jgi:hypothetical protein